MELVVLVQIWAGCYFQPNCGIVDLAPAVHRVAEVCDLIQNITDEIGATQQTWQWDIFPLLWPKSDRDVRIEISVIGYLAEPSVDCLSGIHLAADPYRFMPRMSQCYSMILGFMTMFGQFGM